MILRVRFLPEASFLSVLSAWALIWRLVELRVRIRFCFFKGSCARKQHLEYLDSYGRIIYWWGIRERSFLPFIHCTQQIAQIESLCG